MTWLCSSFALLAVTACSSPTINGFNITAPASISVAQGGVAYLTVSSAATGSSTTPVTSALVLYNLPQGVTYSPAAPTVTTGSQTVIVLSAFQYAPIANNQVQVSGYAQLASSSAIVSVGVVAP